MEGVVDEGMMRGEGLVVGVGVSKWLLLLLLLPLLLHVAAAAATC